MRKYVMGAPMRFFFLVVASVIWTGIWLTGFHTVHWLLYVPAAFFVFAVVTGICPGIIFSNLLFGRAHAGGRPE